MGFPAPGTDNVALRSIDATMKVVAEDAAERSRSERRWRIAGFALTIYMAGIASGSLITALVR